MSQLIDRRQNAGKKSTVNRQRFLRRYKSQIKKAVSELSENGVLLKLTKANKSLYQPKIFMSPNSIEPWWPYRTCTTWK